MKKKKQNVFLPDYGDVNNQDVRAKYGYLEAIVSIIGNIVLFLIKITLALFVNSIGLAADAIHSLSDVSTSGIVVFGFKIAKKRPDKKTPSDCSDGIVFSFSNVQYCYFGYGGLFGSPGTGCGCSSLLNFMNAPAVFAVLIYA